MAITKETLQELIGESEVSEDTLLKIKMMVENTIAEKVEAATSEMKAAHEQEVTGLKTQLEEAEEAHKEEVTDLMEKANQYAQYVVTEMTEKIDSYAEYVVEKFIQDNKTTLVESDEYNRMKSVFEKVKAVFAESYFDIVPSDKTVEIEAKLTEARGAYNEVFNQLQDLKKTNEEMQYAMVFETLTKDLAETQKEKLKALVENVTFESVAEFQRGVELMIAQITEQKSTSGDTSIVEGQDPQPEAGKEKNTPSAGAMERYLKLI